MAPTRKSRSGNKRFSKYPELSSGKDDGNPIQSRQRKRKLSDMLGSQWSKEELERFYEAYRKYGKDWKKVAKVVRSRSSEMVEALYNMNKAYLSLPEGTASVVGLIAMVTDHYNVLEESDTDQESNDASQRAPKPGQGKVQFIASKDLSLSPMVASKNDGCFSLLKRRPSDGCAVRKRTPRFPVKYSFRKDDDDSHVSPDRSNRKSELDDDIEHVAALVLSKASQRRGEGQISQSQFKKDHFKSSPFQSQLSQSEMGWSKILDPAKYGLEDSLGGRGGKNGDYTRDRSALTDIKGVGRIDVYRKGKKVYSKKRKVDDIRINEFDVDRKASSGPENGLDVNVAKGEVDIEASNPKIDQSSSLGKRKRNKKLFFGEENPALDALQTLADLSSMMPASTSESESIVQLMDEKPTFDLADRSSVQKTTSNRRDKSELLGEKVRHGVSMVEASIPEKFKCGRDLATNVNAISEGEQQPMTANKHLKRKCKTSSLKALAEEDEKCVLEVKCTGQRSSPSKQGESIRPVECSSSNSDKPRLGKASAVSLAEVPTMSHANLPIKQSRRKMAQGRTQSQKEINSPGNAFKYQPSKYSDMRGVHYLKDNISCFLSSSLLRRWCTFEWFYSAIDYPWFAKREFVEYLNHARLGHIPRLNRVEWGVIRSSLGKPRRFSEHFLNEEQDKLRQYRESVRRHYTELRAGIQDGLPADLARPLSVGQRVIALHPKSREVHDGSVLTVDHDKCRIQFDRPDLGVEFVMDIDCMPSNPLENMPEALRRHGNEVDNISLNYREQKAGQSNTMEPVVFSPNEQVKNACSPIHTQMNQGDMIYAFSKAKAAPGVEDKSTSLQRKMVSSPLLDLRPCNTYPGNSLSPRLKLSGTSDGFSGPPSSSYHHLIDDQESGSNVVEIVEDSRFKAHTMVDAAIQAMSTMKEGEDAFERIGEALDSLDNRKFTPDCGSAVMSQVNGDVFQQQSSFSTSETLQNGHLSAAIKLNNDPERTAEEFPSELISSCVATLLMVKMCTGPHCPGGDVGQILDSAVTSLRPCCPQNLPIYRDIQMCLGRIKTQIIAMVPT